MVSGKIILGTRKSWAIALSILPAVVIGLGWGQPCQAAQAPTDTLILVNSDPITVSDFDRLVMQAHRAVNMEDQGGNLAGRLLEKRVKDILLIQDALAAGMDEEPAFVEAIQKKEINYAIQQYVKDNLTLPETASEDSVRAFFERYHWRIQIRQLSVRTRAEAEAAKAAVLAGADMDTFAFWKALMDNGVFANAAIAPAVAPGQGLIRTSYTATQTDQQLDRVLEVMEKIGKKMGTIS